MRGYRCHDNSPETTGQHPMKFEMQRMNSAEKTEALNVGQ
jgi:hypothetical protein